MTLILDAGALIAVERRDRATTLEIEVARRRGEDVVVPAGVVGQVWRGSPAQALLARLLNSTDVSVEPLTDTTARAAGVLCGIAQTSDVIDASVVVAARQRDDPVVLTADGSDLLRLDPSLPVIDC